jgi:tRNA 5-methylaminomethyl-2-thiouridine biosynthesis bifunctional protein
LPASATPPLDVVVFQLGYAMPAIDGLRLIGATLQGGDDTSIRAIDHQENLARLNLTLPGFAAGLDPATLPAASASARCRRTACPSSARTGPGSGQPNTRLHNLPRQPGLWCVQGFRRARHRLVGADGRSARFSLEGEPLPLESDLVDASTPAASCSRRHAATPKNRTTGPEHPGCVPARLCVSPQKKETHA